MADRCTTTATTMSVGGHHVTGEIIEMTDSIDTADTNTTTTTTNTDMLNSQTDPSLANASHSAREDNNIRKRDAGSSQESTTAQLQEIISGQDADLTKTDVPTIEQSGTETGYAETTQQNLHQNVGYKREHSHSPCSQTSPVLQQSPTSACRAVGCVVEAEQELVADGEVLKSSGGGQREKEERQPRKRVKREATMEGGEGDGRNESTSLLTSTETPATLQRPSATLQATPHTEQDLHSTLPPIGPNQEHNIIITSTVNLEATATAATQSLTPLPSSPPPPPAITRGAPTRPTSLLVPSAPPSAGVQLHVDADAQHGAGGGGGGEEGGRFPSSEEERTPDGGKSEFVGHDYHSPLRNNGEMVTPEKQPTLPNTVTGYRYPFQRMLSAENNAHRHTYSYALRHAAENGQARMARQNSEPTNELYGLARRLFDNNGRPIQGGGESRIAIL